MLNLRIAGDLYAVHLTVSGDVFDGVFLHCPFLNKISWMRPGTLLSQFLRVFLPTFNFCSIQPLITCHCQIPLLLSYRIDKGHTIV